SAVALRLTPCANKVQPGEPLFRAPVALKSSLARIPGPAYQRPTGFPSDVDRSGLRFSLTSGRTRERVVSCDRTAVSHGLRFRPGSGFMSNGSRRPMDVSPLWLQAMLLTFVVGFAIRGYLALRVHSEYARLPGRVVDEKGRLLMTREEILQGQEAFLTHGLMQFGSVYGHGAYLGPDFTADYLHRQALLMREFY